MNKDYTGKPCPVTDCDGTLLQDDDDKNCYWCRKCGASAHESFLRECATLSTQLASMCEQARYLKEWKQGAEAAAVIANPPNVNGHTEDVYIRHRNAYMDSMRRLSGYADGADCVAAACQATEAKKLPRNAWVERGRERGDPVAVHLGIPPYGKLCTSVPLFSGDEGKSDD